MPAYAVDRRQLLGAAGGAAMLALSGPVLAAGSIFTPERYGAKGDGRTDDSAAFSRLSDAINAAGGGTVFLRRTTYLVGTQSPGADPAAGARLLSFLNCRRLLTIKGNGATLRCAPGQRYGMFQPDGSRTPEIVGKGQVGMARPYAAMIEATGCSGGIVIRDIELDGSSGSHIVGGQRGDKGWQIRCAGIALFENPGPERLENVWSHHQPQDGFYVNGPGQPTPGMERRFVNLRADMNGRQGMSIVGGQDYRIEQSSFTRTGRGKVTSAPGAGVDIEPHRGKQVRNLVFVDCKFMDNRGCGLVADSGDSADVSFIGCTFVGTDNWSVWHDKPGFSFDRCTFAGSLVHAFGGPDRSRVTRFTGCVFTDDPKVSPTGKLALTKSRASNFGMAENVLFDRCQFRMVSEGVLPMTVRAIYRDCTMSQQSSRKASTGGRFEGRNVITGPVNLATSVVVGETILNGDTVPKTV